MTFKNTSLRDYYHLCRGESFSIDPWKDREIYKRLGWLNKNKDESSMKLPESLDEIEFDLHLKFGF
jgi:hypothetical protein